MKRPSNQSALTLVLAAAAAASWPVLAQTASQIEAAEHARQQEIADARRAIEKRAEERRAAIATAWGKVGSCVEIGAFERQYDESGYDRQIEAARRRYCKSVTPGAPVIITPAPLPVRPALTGYATPSGRSKVEFILQGQAIRLAQVIDCNPGSGIDLSTLFARYALVCRPLGQDYQCHIKDSGEDVASIAVANGIARPRGDDYSNEFYAWYAKADVGLPKGAASRQCASGR